MRNGIELTEQEREKLVKVGMPATRGALSIFDGIDFIREKKFLHTWLYPCFGLKGELKGWAAMSTADLTKSGSYVVSNIKEADSYDAASRIALNIMLDYLTGEKTTGDLMGIRITADAEQQDSTTDTPEKRINAYQHVRNKDCIYRRVGDTDTFKWNDHERTQAGIEEEIHMNQKFIPIKDEDDRP